MRIGPKDWIWTIIAIAMTAPILAATQSPLLNWRDPIYIGSGFAGIIALSLLLVQPILVSGLLSRLKPATSKRMHHWIGILLLAAVLIHVLGLWITSPPDVIDALTFASPTPFASWGVIAVISLFVLACLGAIRHRMLLPTRVWRLVHSLVAVVLVGCSLAHVLLIEGTMETVTKWGISILIALAITRTLIARRLWRSWLR